MKNLKVKVFTADRKEHLEREMNEFLTSVPSTFLRDLGFSHFVNDSGSDFYSALIVYEERFQIKNGDCHE